MKHNRFAILNSVMLLMLVASPFLEGEEPLARVLFVALFAVVLIVAVYAVGRRWHARRIVTPLAVLTAIAQIFHLFLEAPVFSVISLALGIVVLLSVILVILGRLFSVAKANYETINAALCVYLLMSILWAIAYSLTETLAPGSFVYPLAGEQTGFMQVGGKYGGIPLYYSIVTMTTLGYGDIVPVGPTARVLATMQAMFGQFYLVVLVARLVGLHVSRSSGEGHKAGGIFPARPDKPQGA